MNEFRNGPEKERIGLVGCVKKKLPHEAPARDLYVSDLFRGRRAYVEKSCDSWFILSALHGLVDPDASLEPYDKTLKDATISERREWARGVLDALKGRLGSLRGRVFEIHAGNDYVRFGLAEGLLRAGAGIERPAEGLGLFEQVAFYASGKRAASEANADRTDVSTTVRQDRQPMMSGTGKYAALRDYLAAADGPLELSFEEVGRIVGDLPASARNHRAWWANDSSHVQARAWIDANMRVESVDLVRGRVRFQGS